MEKLPTNCIADLNFRARAMVHTILEMACHGAHLLHYTRDRNCQSQFGISQKTNFLV